MIATDGKEAGRYDTTVHPETGRQDSESTPATRRASTPRWSAVYQWPRQLDSRSPPQPCSATTKGAQRSAPASSQYPRPPRRPGPMEPVRRDRVFVATSQRRNVATISLLRPSPFRSQVGRSNYAWEKVSRVAPFVDMPGKAQPGAARLGRAPARSPPLWPPRPTRGSLKGNINMARFNA